jgi:hypothetical protein
MHQAGVEGVHGGFKIMVSSKIAQPFMAGKMCKQILPSPVRDGRTFLSSLTGLVVFPNREPSHEWLGYFQELGNGGESTAQKLW